MSIMTSIGRLARRFSAARNDYLTERSIASLPPEVRKDIGWPDAGPFRKRENFASIDMQRLL